MKIYHSAESTALKAESTGVLIGLARLPDFIETLKVRATFEFVIQLIIAFISIGMAQPQVGAVICNQPAFPEIAMRRGDRSADLYIAR